MKTSPFLLLILFSAGTVQGDLVVTGGHLVVSAGVVREQTETTVQSGATLNLASGSELISPVVNILSNGTLRGCGTVTGSVSNEGLILADCGTGSTLILSSAVTNTASGVIRAENDSGLELQGTVENDGVLDLIFSPSSPPAGITGTGTTVTAATLPAISLDPGTGSLTLPAFAGHSYQIQYTDDLAADPVVWINHGAPITVNSAEEETVSVPLPATGTRMFRYVMQQLSASCNQTGISDLGTVASQAAIFPGDFRHLGQWNPAPGKSTEWH
jgi:hypothetical protein